MIIFPHMDMKAQMTLDWTLKSDPNSHLVHISPSSRAILPQCFEGLREFRVQPKPPSTKCSVYCRHVLSLSPLVYYKYTWPLLASNESSCLGSVPNILTTNGKPNKELHWTGRAVLNMDFHSRHGRVEYGFTSYSWLLCNPGLNAHTCHDVSEKF